MKLISTPSKSIASTTVKNENIFLFYFYRRMYYIICIWHNTYSSPVLWWNSNVCMTSTTYIPQLKTFFIEQSRNNSIFLMNWKCLTATCFNWKSEKLNIQNGIQNRSTNETESNFIFGFYFMEFSNVLQCKPIVSDSIN